MNFKSYARIQDMQPMPNLIEDQLASFARFLEYGLPVLFDEITPIQSFNKNFELHFPGTRNRDLCERFDLGFRFGEPTYGADECIERDVTYSRPLYVKTLLYDKERDQAVVREIFFGDFPVMTEQGTFVISGTERVVVSQLIRSPGVYFSREEDQS